jgi:hypothetical protein
VSTTLIQSGSEFRLGVLRRSKQSAGSGSESSANPAESSLPSCRATIKDKPCGWPPSGRPSLTATRHDGGIDLWSGRKNGFAEVEQKNASVFHAVFS